MGSVLYTRARFGRPFFFLVLVLAFGTLLFRRPGRIALWWYSTSTERAACLRGQASSKSKQGFSNTGAGV